MDVAELRAFYSTRLGRLTRQTISHVLEQNFSASPDMRLVGFGYASPYLNAVTEQSPLAISLMPAQQGVVAWPSKGPNRAALVQDFDLPLPDSSVDRMLVVHGLEQSVHPLTFLKEAWRVLVPGGKVCLVVPRRTGLWARMDTTPFGQGRPFSGGQLERALKDALLTPEIWLRALHYAPMDKRLLLRPSARLEKIGRIAWPAFAGVAVVVASKHLYQGLKTGERLNFRALSRPVLVPSPNTSNPRRRSSAGL